MAIVARVSPATGAILRAVTGRYRLSIAAGDDAFIRCVDGKDLDGICWEASRMFPPSAECLAAISTACDRGVSLLLITDARLSSVVRFCATQVRHSRPLSVALIGHDDLTVELANWLNRDCGMGPTGQLLHHFIKRMATPVHGLALSIACLGKRAVSVAEIANVTGCAKRTLEERLKSARAAPPGRLAAWSLAAHAIWGLDVQGDSLKQVAARSGVAGAADLAARIRRSVGATPARIMHEGGFLAALARIDERL